MRTLPLYLLLLACAACSATAPVPAPIPAAPAAPPPLAEMRALAGAAACTDTSQCKTVPLGARACGGPEGYLAYSTATTPEAPMQALAERYAAQRRAANSASGLISTCQMLVDPGAQCRAGTCELGSAK